MVFPARYREGGYFTSCSQKLANTYQGFQKKVSGYFAAERLGVDGKFDENNEEDLSSLRVHQKFRLLSAMTST